MVLPTTVNLTYTVPVIGTQTQANLHAIMAAVALDLTLPRLWGLIPTSDVTSDASAPTRVQRAITLTFDNGATAAITPTVQDGRISALQLGAVSGWWAGVPLLSFSGGFTTPAPPGAVQTPAQAKATMGVGRILIPNGGSGYTGSVTAQLVGGNLAPGGTPAVLGAVVRGGGGTITAVNITSFGSGYTTYPQVVFTDSPGGGSGAEAFGALTIVKVTLTNPGFGYSSVPSVNITVLYLANGAFQQGETQDFTQVGWMRGILTTNMRSPVQESPPLYA